MEENWVQALGTLVTISGLVVVAPYEAGRTLPDLGRAIVAGVHRLRNWLARWVPFLRRKVIFEAGGVAAVHTSAQGSAHVLVGLGEQGTIGEQLFRIRVAIESIQGDMNDLREEESKTRADLIGRIDQLSQDHARLRESVDRHRREQGEVNARGFPLAAVGALLAGVPWWFASWWWSPVLVLVVVVALRWLWTARGSLAAGWSRS